MKKSFSLLLIASFADIMLPAEGNCLSRRYHSTFIIGRGYEPPGSFGLA